MDKSKQVLQDTSGRTQLISIVIPLFNEQDSISTLVQRVVAVLCALGHPYEILLVDDGSQDATWQRIVQMKEVFPFVRGLRLSRNFGHQGALLAGLSNARGEAVISMDGDLQHPPELIPELVKSWKSGVAVVETRRKYGKQTTYFKRITSILFYRVFSVISNVELEPGRSDFRLLNRHALESLLSFQQSDLFLRGVVGWLKYPSVTIDFVADDRKYGSSKYTIKRMLEFAAGGILTFSTRPLVFGVALGLFTGFVSLLYLVYALGQYFMGNTVPGWASLLSFIALLFGVLFILLGIIGGYIGRIYIMLQQRPSYILGEEV